MRYLLIVCVLICSCNTQTKNSHVTLSKVEQRLSEYRHQIKEVSSSSPNDIVKNERLTELERSIKRLLGDTCGNVLDSVRFTVDKIEGTGKLMFVQISLRSADAVCSVPKEAPNYEFIKSMKVGDSYEGKLLYLDHVDVSENSGIYDLIKIDAAPFPIDFKIDSSNFRSLYKHFVF